MREKEHEISVLNQTKEALKKEDAFKLKELSNEKTHSATCFQDSASLTTIVFIYTLSKIVERKHYLNIKNWDSFVKKINSQISLAINSLEEDKEKKYEEYLKKIRKTIEKISPDIKTYIKEIIQNASINKASKLYSHGISMEQTAKLLGVTQWEIANYIGKNQEVEMPKESSTEIKKRAQKAVEFFS